MDVDTVDVFKMEMEPWTVSPSNSRDLRSLDSFIEKKIWSRVLVLIFEFPNPPIVALPLN